MALSEDNGASWQWLCAAAFAVDPRFEDPGAVWTRDGRLHVATYLGLRQASATLPCQVDAPEGKLGEGFVIDVSTGPGGERAYALLSDLNDDDILYASTSVPGQFEALHRNFDLLLGRVRVAPSDPSHLYISAGQVRFAGQPYRTFLLASTDGGRTFERHEFTLEGSENLLLLTAVSPTNPKRVFGEVVGFDGQAALERIVRSDDGGLTWQTVLEAPDARSIAISEDGMTVFVGSTLGGLWRSTNGGARFDLVNPSVHVRCLTWDRGQLYICTNTELDGYGLGVSSDRGETVSPRLRFSEITGMAPCASCSTAGFICPAWTGDVIYDLELDAALPEGFDPDGGTGAPRDLGPLPAPCPEPDASSLGPEVRAMPATDAGVVAVEPESCGCRTPDQGPRVAWPFALLLWLLARKCRT